MTKKDYIKMASQFKEAYILASLPDEREIVRPYLEALIKDFATMLKADNPLFSEEKWNKYIFNSKQ